VPRNSLGEEVLEFKRVCPRVRGELRLCLCFALVARVSDNLRPPKLEFMSLSKLVRDTRTSEQPVECTSFDELHPCVGEEFVVFRKIFAASFGVEVVHHVSRRS
jgi:hypothetical protein